MKRNVMPVWADALLTFWIILVAVIFFVPSVAPMLGAESLGQRIGAWTQPASLVYLLILIGAVITLTLRLLHHRGKSESDKS